jgi:hypothetical protein
MVTKRDSLQGTRKLMAALLRQPPKPHEKMKLGRAKPTVKRSGTGERAKPKNA